MGQRRAGKCRTGGKIFKRVAESSVEGNEMLAEREGDSGKAESEEKRER